MSPLYPNLPPDGLTTIDIQAAYRRLSEKDRKWIDYQAVMLEKGVRAKKMESSGTQPYFGHEAALEVLAKLGIHLIEKGIWHIGHTLEDGK